MREPGFYWVKAVDTWIVSEWDGKRWFPAPPRIQGDSNKIFNEIDERRIVRDETCKDNQFKGAKLKVWDKDWNLVGTINCDPVE